MYLIKDFLEVKYLIVPKTNKIYLKKKIFLKNELFKLYENIKLKIK